MPGVRAARAHVGQRGRPRATRASSAATRAPPARGAGCSSSAEAAPDGALISHEFFGAACAEQAERALADLGDAEAHVIVTARDMLGLLTSQLAGVREERRPTARSTASRATDELGDEWGWAAVDLQASSSAGVPPSRRSGSTWSCCPSPARRASPGAPLRRGDGDRRRRLDLEGPKPNSSLGVVEAELLRRINPRLTIHQRPRPGVWIRGVLAHDVWCPAAASAFWPSAARVAELRARADAALEASAPRATTSSATWSRCGPRWCCRSAGTRSVTDGGGQAAAGTIAACSSDVRRQRRRLNARRPGPVERLRSGVRRVLRRAPE